MALELLRSKNGEATALEVVSGAYFQMRSTPLFELDPLERVPGPSLGENRPKTAKAKIAVCSL
jgi:hypothetical protein